MKKFKFFGMMAIAAMAVSCSSDDVVQQVQEDNAIQFSTYIGNAAQSRGLEINGAQSIDGETMGIRTTGWGLLAAYTEADYKVDEGFKWNMNFMWNQKIQYTENVGWNYSPLKYWPTKEHDKISFFAYAPYSENQTVGDYGIKLSDNKVQGIPTITFTVQDKVEDMVDLVTDVRYNTTHDDAKQANPAGNEVVFNLNHELTRVTMKAIVDERATVDASDTRVVITSVKLNKAKSQLYKSATYTFANINDADGSIKRGTWSYAGAANFGADYDLAASLNKTANNNDLALAFVEDEAVNTAIANGIWLNPTATTATSLFGENQYLFLIPPAGEGGVAAGEAPTAVIEYYIITKDEKLAKYYSITKATKEVSLGGATGAELLKQGKAYAYTFKIGLDEIKVSASVEAWEIGDDVEVKVEYQDTDY